MNTLNYRSNPFGQNFLRVPGVTTHLKYQLVPVECAVEFQIHEQSQAVTNYLKDGYFQASNGLRVATADFPEFKDSQNVIYLRGKDKSNDNKVDTTRFIRNSVRDAKIDLINEALKELVENVKKATSYTSKPSLLDEMFFVIRQSPKVKVINLG